MQHFLFGMKSAGSCYLIIWVFFGISKFFNTFFVRRIHRCCVGFVQIGEITWEELEEGRLTWSSYIGLLLDSVYRDLPPIIPSQYAAVPQPDRCFHWVDRLELSSGLCGRVQTDWLTSSSSPSCSLCCACFCRSLALSHKFHHCSNQRSILAEF